MKFFHIAFIAFFGFFYGGCAFFNTFYHARKSYNAGVQSIQRSRDLVQATISNKDVPPERFTGKLAQLPSDAKIAFDVAIEKANKVIVLHPGSGWVENAILLSGKAHYMRAQNSDMFDARNRFEVFLAKYPDSKRVPEARLWYGKALWQMGQLTEALQQLEQVTANGADDDLSAEAGLLRGDIAWQREDFLTAAKQYVKASAGARSKGLRKEALYKAAYAYYSLRQTESAIYYMEQLARIDLEFQEKFDSEFMRARMLKDAGKHSQGIRILDRLLGNPKYASLFVRSEFEIADILRLQGKNRAAEKQFLHVISTYPNPVFAGDSYYMLGLMHDSPVLTGADDFQADPTLALKFFHLVKTRYPASTFHADATARIDRAVTMETFHHAITLDNLLLQATEARLADPTSGLQEYWPSIFSVSDSAALLDETVGGEDSKNNPLLDVYRTHITSPDKDQKQSWAEQFFLDLTEMTDIDSLDKRRDFLRQQVFTDIILLADYFYYQRSEYDSSFQYYQLVAEEDDGAFREYALYGIARVMQKKNHPDHLAFYAAALDEFPKGQLADIGRRVLKLDTEKSTIAGKLRTAESTVMIDRDYVKGEQLYLQVALEDSSTHRWQALYALGWLNEQKLHRNDEAFRYYQTLVYAQPRSAFARRVKPKCDAYAKEKNIPPDSLIHWVDTRFVSLRKAEDKTAPADTAKNAETAPEINAEEGIPGSERSLPAESDSDDDIRRFDDDGVKDDGGQIDELE